MLGSGQQGLGHTSSTGYISISSISLQQKFSITLHRRCARSFQPQHDQVHEQSYIATVMSYAGCLGKHSTREGCPKSVRSGGSSNNLHQATLLTVICACLLNSVRNMQNRQNQLILRQHNTESQFACEGPLEVIPCLNIYGSTRSMKNKRSSPELLFLERRFQQISLCSNEKGTSNGQGEESSPLAATYPWLPSFQSWTSLERVVLQIFLVLLLSQAQNRATLHHSTFINQGSLFFVILVEPYL